MKSINQKIDKIRKPRVHITYDVEGSETQEKKEIPFVVGVLGDYSGHNQTAQKPFKECKFVNIDANNFSEVMQKIQPRLELKVENHLATDGTQMTVNLFFNSMEDFEPECIAKQVPALKQLLDIRERLKELLSKADRSEELEIVLEKILQDQEQIKLIAQQAIEETSQEIELTENKE